MTIVYLFRKPKFPIICSVDDFFITAKSEAEFQRKIAKVELTPDARYNMVDSTGEGWEFYTNKMYVIPAVRRKWSKKRIIQAYNDSKNCRSVGITYSDKSLSSKPFGKIHSDIIELIEQSQ